MYLLPVLLLKLIDVDVVFLFGNVLNSAKHEKVVVEVKHGMATALGGGVGGDFLLPCLGGEGELPEVVECGDAVGTAEYVQCVVMAYHRQIGPPLGLISRPLRRIDLLPFHSLQIQTIYVIHELCLGWYVSTIEIHFLIEHSNRMRVKIRHLNIPLHPLPLIHLDIIDIRHITTLRRTHLPTKHYNLISSRYSRMILQPDQLTFTLVVQFLPYIVCLSILLGKVDAVEIAKDALVDVVTAVNVHVLGVNYGGVV